MVDPTPGTEATKVLPSSGTTTPAVSARPFAGSRCKLSTGTRWQGYQVDGPAPSGRANAFEATHVGRMEKVVITASLLSKTTSARRAIWEQLSSRLPPDTKIPACVEAQEEEGWRYEVTAQPPAMTLREWIACHQAEAWVQKQMLEQLANVLTALHSQGIVHLNLRPENIYLTGEGNKMELFVAGLETAVMYKQSGSVVALAEVDPFYGPPEAVDAGALQPGIGLCAWDWWSVGRIIQEMILGRHVMSMLFGSDVTRDPAPEVRDRAKALLLELEPPGLRAGAVEAMPGLDLPMKVMLRGLLTSARDARWGGEAVRLWLAKESVSNHYDLARNARFFTWKGSGRTLSEAAQYFRTEENWADGELNIFEVDDPTTLANFISTVPGHSADWRKLQEIHAHVASAEWSGIPEAARRSVAAALAWLMFGPQPGAFVVKGRRIDGAGLTELLNSQDSGNYEIVKALMSAPCLELIAPLDAAAGESLAQLAALGGEALRKAEQHRWVDMADPGSLAYVLKLSLEPEPILRKRAERVRTTYALCEDAELEKMLTAKNPAPWANVLLVFTGENPRKFGYITRVEQARRRRAELQARAVKLRLALFWLRLRHLLLAGRPWSGSWSAFALFWLGVVGFGVVIAREVAVTTGLAFGLMALRFILGWRIQVLVSRSDPAASRWTWREGPERCLTEAQRVQAEEKVTTLPQLTRQLVETETALAALAPVDNNALPDKELPLSGLWPVFAAAALLCLIGPIQLVKDFGQNIDSAAFGLAWTKPAAGTPAERLNRFGPETPEEIAALLETFPGLDPDMVEKVKRGEYEIVKEAFGHTLNGPIKKWAFSPPAEIESLPVKSRAPATSAQRAFALVSGELLLRPYGKKGVTALLVVRVPTPEGVSLMLYNAKARKLVDNDALALNGGVTNETWYQLGRTKVIYLGAPSQMNLERESFLSKK